MAKQGEVIENPAVGERIVFLKTTWDTDGELLQIDDFVKPRSVGPPEHVHPRQEERFEVVSGTLRVRMRGREQSLNAGQSLAVPPGTPHTWWNDSDTEARILVEFRPASKMEAFFETFFGLARDGKLNDTSVPHPLQIAILSSEYEIYLAKPPIPLQEALFAMLTPIGRLLGYKARYQSTGAQHEPGA